MSKINSYKVIIVDDEPTARSILEHHIQKIDKLEIVASCKNAIEAFSVINQQSIDLIFLDINMPEISGLSFAKAINKDVKIIFTTAYREYAVEGFDLKAVDYLLKPITLERLIQAVNRFKEQSLPNTPQPSTINHIFVRSDRKMIKIVLDEILYIESLNDYLKVFTTEKTIVIRETITNFEQKLPSTQFLRCHRSFIIAMDKVDAYTHEFFEIQEKEIPISRSYRKAALEFFQ